MDQKECHDVREFLEVLLPLNSQWRENEFKRNTWIYRGQWEPENENRSLLPSSLRDCFKESLDLPKILSFISNEDVIKKKIIESVDYLSIADYKNINMEQRKRLKKIAAKSILEFCLLERFIQNCNKVALPLDDISLEIKQVRMGSRDYVTTHVDFNRLPNHLFSLLTGWLDVVLKEDEPGKDFPPLFEYKNYYPLAIAQHSKIPTRLLDWSFNPLKAAFFATPSQKEKDQMKGKKASICVYALNTAALKYPIAEDISLTIHSSFKHSQFEFLHAQEGAFIEMRGADFYYYEHGEWPSLIDYIEKFSHFSEDFNESEFKLKKFSLPDKLASELLSELEEMKISKATLMPSYFHCADDVMGR